MTVTAEHNAVEADGLAKLIGLRPSQIKRVVIRNADEDKRQRVELQLARVSSNDIRLIERRLRREPGVHEVKATARAREAAKQAE